MIIGAFGSCTDKLKGYIDVLECEVVMESSQKVVYQELQDLSEREWIPQLFERH